LNICEEIEEDGCYDIIVGAQRKNNCQRAAYGGQKPSMLEQEIEEMLILFDNYFKITFYNKMRNLSTNFNSPNFFHFLRS